MRVVVYGAGSLGSVVGGLLTRRHEVTLVGRQAHVQAIEESGLVITGLVEAVVVPKAVEDIRGLPPADVVVITVKSYDTEQALDSIRPLVDARSVVVSLQNGLNNASLLLAAYPGQAVVGVTSLGATRTAPGRVFYAGEGDTYFGTVGADQSLAANVAEAFASVGLDSYVSEDIMAEVWTKAIVNASVNPLTAIARCKNGKVLQDRFLLELAQAACQEGSDAARACGIRLGDEDVFTNVRDVLRRTAENKSSMLQDVERRKRTEIDEISGELVRRAEAAGIKVPINRALWLLVKSLTQYP